MNSNPLSRFNPHILRSFVKKGFKNLTVNYYHWERNYCVPWNSSDPTRGLVGTRHEQHGNIYDRLHRRVEKIIALGKYLPTAETGMIRRREEVQFMQIRIRWTPSAACSVTPLNLSPRRPRFPG